MSGNSGEKNHWTTRRAAVAALGFGGISLYGLWAGYGAAPGPLALLGVQSLAHPAVAAGGGHGEAMPTMAAAGEHGGHTAAAPPPMRATAGHAGHVGSSDGDALQRFREATAQFIERYRDGDGNVYPRPDEAHGIEGGAVDIYMLAGMWYYQPNALRLDAGRPYRFRIMTSDISHGASIQFGRGARMIRLRPGRVTDSEITFTKAGRYFVYCTVYCGPAHDTMQAAIEVA